MSATILQGDCLETLKTLEPGSVQTCVTSPPYFNLRDYQTASWEGGDSECDHKQIRGGNGESSYISTTNPGTQNYQYRGTCPKCGAVRIDNQIGMEETPEEYADKLVCVFREVRKALKDDGTLWLNLGDSYAGSGHGWQKDEGSSIPRAHLKDWGEQKPPGYISSRQANGIKPKDLIGIPWMVAFALRADGWYLRSDIIWHKPNPMPESVTDRPTKSHEYIFLLSKSAQYYYDYEAILEPANYDGRKDTIMKGSTKYQNGFGPTDTNPNTLAVKGHERWINKIDGDVPARNKRDVWTVTTKPYAAAHFATFPPDLIEPCILAGSRIGDTVLDPFSGSGTTGAVAIKHHRNYVGCELNPAYIELTNKRLSQVQPVLFGATQ